MDNSGIGVAHYSGFLSANLYQGAYAVTAVAIDGSGNSGSSTVVNITVGNRPPIISLTYPTNSQTFRACSTILLNPSLIAGSAAVTSVDF